jgi:AcrR family transcriptional regulator
MEVPASSDRKPASRRTNRRDQIVAAAEELMRTRGLAAVTTRQVAAQVGCSEAAIYVHFKGRLELLLAVLGESLPDMLEPFRILSASVGRNTPEENLEVAANGMMAFQGRVIPMIAGLFAEREVLNSYRESLLRDDKGPQRATATIAAYLKSEQELERISKVINVSTVASLLVSAVFFRCFTQQFFESPSTSTNDRYLKQVIATLLRREAQ